MTSKLPFYVIHPDNSFHFTDYPDDLVDLISEQNTVDTDQTFTEALRDDWSDEDLRLEAFGPHFTEETLKDTLDLCEAVEAMNKGYIL
ncbi:hypothetical protein [Pararhizobium sp. A13]|uniref:hypothetical protein n=1 Tax=Pararhizobium sp. A13 TaxID=3133975 RepID=UPI00324AAA8D